MLPQPAERPDGRAQPVAEPSGWVRVLLFLAAFAWMVWYGLENSQMPFRGDAHETWEVAKHFYEPGRARSFVEYRGPFTFAFYNVLYVASQWLGVHDVAFFRNWSALVFACMATLLFPRIFAAIFARPVGVLKIAAFTALMFWFFRGYFLHPQTDVPALFFLLLAVRVALWVVQAPRWLWLGSAVLGALVACSMMMRISYVLAAPLLWMFCMRALRAQGQGWGRTAGATLLSVVVCALLASANTGPTSGTSALVGAQLKGGMTLQKIEWNAGDPVYPGALKVNDRRGAAILQAEGLPLEGSISVGAYLSLFGKYPVDMLILQAKHLFGGLDITYHAVYIQDLHAPRVLLSLVNYTCIFLALVVVRARLGAEGVGWRTLPLLLAIGAQSAAAIPFIGEVRFFLPLILTVLAVVVFNLEEGVAQVHRNGLALHGFVFVALCFMLSASLFETGERVLLFTSP